MGDPQSVGRTGTGHRDQETKAKTTTTTTIPKFMKLLHVSELPFSRTESGALSPGPASIDDEDREKGMNRPIYV